MEEYEDRGHHGPAPQHEPEAQDGAHVDRGEGREAQYGAEPVDDGENLPGREAEVEQLVVEVVLVRGEEGDVTAPAPEDGRERVHAALLDKYNILYFILKKQ